DHLAEFTLDGACSCHFGVEIDQPDNFHPAHQQWMGGDSRKPSLGHASAAGQNRRVNQDNLPVDFSAALPSCAASETQSVNVYDASIGRSDVSMGIRKRFRKTRG